MKKGFNFICPFTKSRLVVPCEARSCSFYSKAVSSHCIWEYVLNRKENLSAKELSIITGIPHSDIDRILKRAKSKIALSAIRNKRIREDSSVPYCKVCGRAFNIVREENGSYVCRNHKHIRHHKYTEFENETGVPIAHILTVLPKVFKSLRSMRYCLGFRTNREVRKAYREVLGVSAKKYIPRASLSVSNKTNNNKQ